MAGEYFWTLGVIALASNPAAQDSRPTAPSPAVDLTDRRLGSILETEVGTDAHGLARPWYQKLDVWGFGSGAFLDTGDVGTRPEGSFMVKEASVYFAAHAWEDISVEAEIKLIRQLRNDDQVVRVSEVYIHLRDVLRSGSPDTLNAKIGRFDIPFGEEYLTEDSIDNPMVNFSAAYPYGHDEGVLLHGQRWGVGWVAAVTNGVGTGGQDDNDDKAFNLKLSGRPLPSSYLSASVMHTGRTESSAVEFGGPGITPVGATFRSSAGQSPSEKVAILLWELDARQDLGAGGSVGLSFGQAHLSDPAPGFDRDLTWFSVEPRVNLSSEVYAIARWSEFGTYSEREGIVANGKITAGGAGAYGWDTSRLQRLAVCLGYRPTPNLVLKLEVGRDRFWLIDASPLRPEDDNRLYYAVELTVGF